MTKKQESVEIYAREVNEPITLKLFLKARLYGCNYQAGSRMAEALYFAPHFGRSIANQHPGVCAGISYIARIESVAYATTWREFSDMMIQQENRGRVWLKRHSELLKALHRSWIWSKGQHRCFLLLGEPRLAFNPPVRRESLQKGKGRLGKRFLSFDEIFRGWGK